MPCSAQQDSKRYTVSVRKKSCPGSTAKKVFASLQNAAHLFQDGRQYSMIGRERVLFPGASAPDP